MRQSNMPTTAPPDDAATRRAAEIEQFLAQHAQRLVGALTLITGDRAAAEDVLQDALVKAWHRKDQPIEQLAAWLTVVATNQARSGRRRRAAEGRALTKVGGRAATDARTEVDLDDDLHRALRGLPLRERQVAVLHYVLDQSVAQVATALGVAEGTVKTLLSRARQHLAAQLGLESQGGVA